MRPYLFTAVMFIGAAARAAHGYASSQDVHYAEPPAATAMPSPTSSAVYEQQAAPAASTFHGYVCTVDCSGHEAGYNWAEQHDVSDSDDCPIDPHNSHSFTEGCWAYAEEQDEDEDGYGDDASYSAGSSYSDEDADDGEDEGESDDAGDDDGEGE